MERPGGVLPEKKFDICVVGGGILGACIAFWISEVSSSSVALIEMENRVATHTSSRNTGVVHRPFYLNPEKKRRFAKAARESYPMWEKLAKDYSLPWRPVGILEAATDEGSLQHLEKYKEWAAANGMAEDETAVLDAAEAKAAEPLVECKGAFLSRADASVDYQKFTEAIFSLARKNGVEFLGGRKVTSIALRGGDGVVLGIAGAGERSRVECRFLVNASGGGALRLAHSLGLAKGFAELHFRGDYWSVQDERVSSHISHNLYSVPKRTEFPFLDPHLVLRANGRVEVGPNAAMVAGPYVYDGLTGGGTRFSEFFARPLWPKLKLIFNAGFLSLVREEWQRSVSKKAMCERVGEFVPTLDYRMLGSKGAGGVRNSLVDSGGFVPEVVEEWSGSSVHILNYNSPGATGAPAFSAQVVSSLIAKGHVDGSKIGAAPHKNLWSFESSYAT